MTRSLRPHSRLLPGQLLLEVLIVISIAAVILILVSQTTLVSLKGSKNAGDRNVATGLSEEVFEAVQDTAYTRWQRLYADIGKGPSNLYYTVTDAQDAWTFATGTETVTVNGVGYTRSFYAQNVCRSVTSTITGITDTNGTDSGINSCDTSTGTEDPSTQKVTVAVSWDGGTISSSQYIARWRNKVCVQTDWSGGVVSATTSCPTTGYDSKNNINIGDGTSLQIQ